MANALVDLQVAARLGLRELGRRVRGERDPAPDLGRFRAVLDEALAKLPSGLVAEARWIALPANEPPWRDSGIALAPGQELTYFAAGRAIASPALDLWVPAQKQIWARIGEDGPIRSSSRASNTLRAERGGRVYFGNYFPNDWIDAKGARLQPDAVYAGMSGENAILAIRWSGSAEQGLAALAAAGDPLDVVGRERERIALGDPAPAGWHYLWHLGDAEIYQPSRGPGGEPAIACEVEGDVGILQRDVAFPLREGTEIAWRWRVDALPGLVREDTLPSHDYLSVAVEFANGLDITYFWSVELPVGAAFWCPLPNWKHREFHVAIRSGKQGLGAWHEERRDLHADALRWFGKSPGDVVRVWLIANSLFKRRRGSFAVADIRLSSGGGSERVL